MDFGRAFTYVFDDPDWLKKVGIIALIGLVPLIGMFILMGWSLEVTRRVIGQGERPLPDLDFGAQLTDGLKAFAVVFVYLLPVWLLLVPMIAISALLENQGRGAEAIIGFTLLCCNGLIILYSFALAFVLPAAYGRLAVTGSIGAALRFREVIELVRAAPGAYLLALLGTMLTGIIAQLGMIACFIGIIFTFAYAMAVNGHLYGQAYNESIRNRAGFARVY